MSGQLNEETGFKLYSPDQVFHEALVAHMTRHNIDPATAVFHFPVLARRQWLKRFLAHVDLFKMSLEVPGDVLEVGVFRGLGLFTWANLLEIYCLGDRTKTVWGLENWTGFDALSDQDGGEQVSAGKIQGGFSPAGFKTEVADAIKLFDSDRFVPWKDRIRLIDGDAGPTVEALLEERPGLRFSLVHFDVDLYSPTLSVLNSIWTRVPVGGVLIFDEYGIPDWPGESQAVDEFLEEHPGQRLETFSWTNAPGAYLVKRPDLPGATR